MCCIKIRGIDRASSFQGLFSQESDREEDIAEEDGGGGVSGI